MRIGIIGSGTVGRSLAFGLSRHGHDVMLGARDVHKTEVREFVSESDGRGRAGSYPEAARFGDVVITAFPDALLDDVIDAMGPENLAGKLIIDAVNPLKQVDGVTVPAFGVDDSAAERLQRAIPSARVVKAYNTITAARMVDPDPADGPTTMRIAGDDPEAKAAVSTLLEQTGWSVRDLGGLENARALEAQVATWVQSMAEEREP